MGSDAMDLADGIKHEEPQASEHSLISRLPTPVRANLLVNRGLQSALQGANLLQNTSPRPLQGSPEIEDLRCKLLESEVTRLRKQLLKCEESNMKKDGEMDLMEQELIKTRGHVRRTEEELDRVQRDFAQYRQNITTLQSNQAAEIRDLKNGLEHQKELVAAFQQLLVAQTRSVAPALPTDPLHLRPSLKRSVPDSLDVEAKKPKLDIAELTSQTTSTRDGMLSSIPAYSGGRSESVHTRPAAATPGGTYGRRNTLRGSDYYDPPYAAKRQDIDRYVPAAPGTIPPVTPYHSRVSSVPPLAMPGTATLAYARAQQLGIRYDPAKQPGIPSKCGYCALTLPSRSKLEQHLRAVHGAHRTTSTPGRLSPVQLSDEHLP